MATVLDSLTLPCSSALASPASSSSSSSSSSFSGRRSSVPFSQFTGLKIRPSFSSCSIRSVKFNSRFSHRSGRIACEAQKTTAIVPPITENDWQKLVLDSTVPVLVEFWAPWCGPCRMIHPVIDELSKVYSDKYKFYKMNTDESPNIASLYGIRSIPTVIIFKGGEKKEAIIGAVPKDTLSTSIDKYL